MTFDSLYPSRCSAFESRWVITTLQFPHSHSHSISTWHVAKFPHYVMSLTFHIHSHFMPQQPRHEWHATSPAVARWLGVTSGFDRLQLGRCLSCIGEVVFRDLLGRFIMCSSYLWHFAVIVQEGSTRTLECINLNMSSEFMCCFGS